MKNIRWGIIGVGDVTEKKSGPAFQKAEGSALVAVMRRSADKAEDYAKRHGVPKWYSDADALINDAEVDAVYIATPTSSHKDYVVEVAAAGKPVFVEKPMALNTAECEEMIHACQTAGVPLFVAYYRRKLPRFEKMRQLIQSGAIGTPRVITVRHFSKEEKMPGQLWKVDPKINGGGIFVDTQAHALDWMDYTFGPVQSVQGVALNQGGTHSAEDLVSYSFTFDRGVIANGICAYSTAHEEESVTVYGNKGTISMGFFRASPVSLITANGEELFDIPDLPHVHQPLVQSIVNELLGKGKSPSTGETALRTTRVIDEVLERFRKQQQT